MWSFMMSYNIGGLTLAQYLLNRMLYPLCTNGSRALGRWTRCQGQRSAVLQWWTSSCPRHLTTKYLPIPSRPAPSHAARRCQWPIFLFPPFISSCAPHSLCPATFGRPKGTCYLHNKRLPTFCLAAAVNRFVLCTAAPRHATHVFSFIITLSLQRWCVRSLITVAFLVQNL